MRMRILQLRRGRLLKVILGVTAVAGLLLLLGLNSPHGASIRSAGALIVSNIVFVSVCVVYVRESLAVIADAAYVNNGAAVQPFSSLVKFLDFY